LAHGQAIHQLAASAYHTLANPTTDIVFPVKCDSHGNVYYLFSARGFGRFDVAKFAPDGSQEAIYSYADVSELKNAVLLADSVSDYGELYELVRSPDSRVRLLRFAEDGRLVSTKEIESPEPFTPAQLEVLPDGTLFVSGTIVGAKTGHGAGQPVNAFYGSDGGFLRYIRLKKDPGRLKKPMSSTDRSGSENTAVHFGMTAVGDEGNLYVLRAANPAVVYVLSPGARVERILTVRPPKTGALPIAILAHGGRVAIEFSLPDAPDLRGTTIRVVDAQSGRTLADYGIPQELTAAVACYDGEQFTFVGMRDGWRSLIQATAH
jgi:hypothetical protein